MTLANLGAVVYMSNYHTVMTTLANLGAVGCSPTIIRSRVGLTTNSPYISKGRRDRMLVGLTTTAPRLAMVVMTAW